jgi:flagellar basal body-associated protein FliL
MFNNKKMMAVLALPILLFGGYTMTKPKPVIKQKVAGTIYVMPQAFLLNLSDGRFAKVSVALQLAPGQSDGAAAGASSSSSESTAGTLPEEPLVREIVTNAVTGQNGEALISARGRDAIRRQILSSIKRQTDVKVEAVLLPDFTVQ